MPFNRMLRTLFWATVIGMGPWSLAPIILAAHELPNTEAILKRVEPWQSAFAESEVTFHWLNAAPATVQNQLTWSLSTSEGTTLGRGELSVDARQRANQKIEFSVQLPPVKPGVILPLRLVISNLKGANKLVHPLTEEIFWVYSREPFADRKQWLDDLKLVIYDPVGRTVERLKEAGVPAEQISNLASLDAELRNFVLVGEGVSFREERGLAKILCHAVEEGAAVLCLAPSEGEFPVPSQESGKMPSNMRLAGRDFLSQLDKRLDAEVWFTHPVILPTTLKLVGSGREVNLEVVDNDKNWTWLEVGYPPRNIKAHPGRFMVTCLPIVERWEDGPTPRFLFARLLEYLSAPSDPTPKVEGSSQ